MKKIFIVIVVMLLMQVPSIAENTLEAGVKKTAIKQEDKTIVEFEDANIKITRDKKFIRGGLKDINKCGYIYTVTNKSNKPVIIKKVFSPDRIYYAIYTTHTFYGSPVAAALTVVSLGLDILTENEINMYLEPFPHNYIINQNSSAQVLFLAKNYIDPRVKFEFDINDQSKTINTKSTYIVKDTKYYKDLLDSQDRVSKFLGLDLYIANREIPLIEASLKSGTLSLEEEFKSNLLWRVISSESNQKTFGTLKGYKTVPYITEENIKIIEMLLSAGANPNAENVKSLMFQAMTTEDPKIISLLLTHGADPNSKYMGEYPTYQAITYNQPEILKLLLDAGADPNACVKDKTLLHWSIRKKHPEMVKLLIKKGADIGKNEDEKNKFYGKYSLLAYAVKKKQIETVKYLLSTGAPIDEDAIKYAKKSKDENIKNLILLQSK